MLVLAVLMPNVEVLRTRGVHAVRAPVRHSRRRIVRVPLPWLTMDFDKLVHQPTRLRLFAYLYQHGETSFQDLKAALDVTEGNLSSHLQTMEDAGAVDVEKQFVDRRPQRPTNSPTRDTTSSKPTSTPSNCSSIN